MARAAAKRRISALGNLPKRVDRAQARVEKALRQAWKATLDALPPRTRKAVKDVTRRVEKTAAELDRRRKKAMKTAEARRKRMVAELEDRATKAGKTVVSRLNIASRHDLERLSRRVAQLERRTTRKSRPAGKPPVEVAA